MLIHFRMQNYEKKLKFFSFITLFYYLCTQ